MDARRKRWAELRLQLDSLYVTGATTEHGSPERQAVLEQLESLLASVKRLMSSEHFSVDGTLLRAWASHSSLERIDGIDDDPPPPSGGCPATMKLAVGQGG
jgi:hypothetical protein